MINTTDKLEAEIKRWDAHSNVSLLLTIFSVTVSMVVFFKFKEYILPPFLIFIVSALYFAISSIKCNRAITREQKRQGNY
ncbi:hypothetical protein A3B18_00175 [Candidatus Giovannonibacteria bacterium RIFCSPLOWO2_01_FULL_46_13]|uniref:Uncharacterized protein n=1 Tax=Candidatus Giovannonibacteria bacterium RIFCSPLOWO2_01_FULL_46_13 TaxID=1798352 RepID=A0A1F5X395_9BACT|nr:MAG: hypothetical protein A3B18_00175 [Candidatus Giovannonibacteria bacterium RIFCSPLOWO2_01_FULL_46_13]